jgi:hypothetical protein
LLIFKGHYFRSNLLSLSSYSYLIIKELAELTGFQQPTKYSFDPQDYSDYEHTISYQDGSAIENIAKYLIESDLVINGMIKIEVLNQ